MRSFRVTKRMAIALLLMVGGVTGCILSVGDRTGARAVGERLERMRESKQWDTAKERFDNPLPRVDGSWFKMTTRFLWGGSDYREPQPKLGPFTTDSKKLRKFPKSGLRVTWLGHSSMVVEVDGVRTLVDPIWSERASPFTWAGPKRFYEPTISFDDLPSIDAVIISHDHYDHLDSETIKVLSKRDMMWLAPLGVGAHLEQWGVSSHKIIELDWWESYVLKGVMISATPSRHFSGRSITFGDQNATLWAGWAWVGPTHRVFYSGDTALHNDFETIGERLGPFDITMMEVGAYDGLWPDVHLGPEQAILAHRLVGGRIMIPVHWGLFDLALHGWTEPIERCLAAANKVGAQVAVIQPGESVDIAHPVGVARWWPDTPWQTVQKAPAWSTSVRELQIPLRKDALSSSK